MLNSIAYYILQFVLGGASVVGIGLIAKYIDPKYTGIFYALPVISVIAMIFVYLDQGLAVSEKTLKSIFIYEFTILYFLGSFYILLHKINFWWALTIAWVTWAIIAFFVQHWFKL